MIGTVRSCLHRQRCRQRRNADSSSSTDVSDRDLQFRLDQASRESERLRSEKVRLWTLLSLSEPEPSSLTVP